MYKNIYFLGIGGIGMSALARYFLHDGRRVAGYDRTRTPLTAELEAEGALIHYHDDARLIPADFHDPATTMVVYTPAVPKDSDEYRYFEEFGYTIEKRSQMLGELSKGSFVMAVAGTHGKTSTSTLVAWINRSMSGGGCAFLGGISKNFGSNLVLGDGQRLSVEADEFDRSFLRLSPNAAVITSADADHLDIYGTHEAVKEAFSQFVGRIENGGYLVIKLGVEIELPNPNITIYRYSYDQPCDFYASNIRLQKGGYYIYDFVTPTGKIVDCRLGIPGWVNVENAVAASALAWCASQVERVAFDDAKLREALASFEGVKRRFEFYVNTPKSVYMDDYAHHPRELAAALSSVRAMFPERKITAIFQPHLYTRTRDLSAEFAEALSLSDRVILLPIYPARELPIEGVTSEIIAQGVGVECQIVEIDQLVETIKGLPTDVVVSFGAGSIDTLCESLAEVLKNKNI